MSARPVMATLFPLAPPAPVLPSDRVCRAAARLYRLHVGGDLYALERGPVHKRYERKAALLLDHLDEAQS